jgi:uncharacterized cofD-like protein
LRAVRHYGGDITAIVSVADDGGSSGRLREIFGVPPPGDLRKCLVALSTPSVWSTAFEHRFDAGELEGHALGNLVIAGLAASTGDFLFAVEEAGRLVDAGGAVLPATTVPVVLKADAAGGAVQGQVAVGQAERIVKVSLVPPDPSPPPAALTALARADQIVLGPGSLYTSVLAVVAVPALREALAVATGRKVYVCNLRPQVPETEGYDVAAHLAALESHGVEVDVVLCDTSGMHLGAPSRPWLEARLARPNGLAHDSDKLAAALVDLVG